MPEVMVKCDSGCGSSNSCPSFNGGFKKIAPSELPSLEAQRTKRDEIHTELKLLKDVLISNSPHRTEILAIIDKADCAGDDLVCDHECGMDDLGHCGDVIKYDGKFEHICDPNSIDRQIKEIEAVIKACQDNDCKDVEIKASIERLNKYASELRLIKACTVKMCSTLVSLKSTASGTAISAGMFDSL